MTDHPTTQPPEASDREQQLAAVKVLTELIADDSMPLLSWGLSVHMPSCLDGYVPSSQGDEERRDVVAFWADFLEVDVTERDGGNERGPWTDVITAGVYHDINVKVWTRIYREEAGA